MELSWSPSAFDSISELLGVLFQLFYPFLILYLTIIFYFLCLFWWADNCRFFQKTIWHFLHEQTLFESQFLSFRQQILAQFLFEPGHVSIDLNRGFYFLSHQSNNFHQSTHLVGSYWKLVGKHVKLMLIKLLHAFSEARKVATLKGTLFYRKSPNWLKNVYGSQSDSAFLFCLPVHFDLLFRFLVQNKQKVKRFILIYQKDEPQLIQMVSNNESEVLFIWLKNEKDIRWSVNQLICFQLQLQIVCNFRQMEKADKEKIFQQFYLAKAGNLNTTMTSKYEKVIAMTMGCMTRKNKNLYQGQKYFIEDLQAIMSFDPESANVVFKDYPEIKYSYNESNQADSRVKVQCKRCGQYTAPEKYCPKCENTHYCSEVCEFNIKLTHQKQECRIKCYPKVHHPVLIQVHFGTNLGHNLEVYFQHETRAYALVKGKQIIKNIFEYFTGIKKTSNPDFIELDRRSKIEEKLMGYKVELKNNQKYVEFQKKDEKDFPTGVLKVDLESLDGLKRIYEQNQILEEIELYLLREGALMINCAQEIHNNHVNWVYIFRMP